MAREIRSRAPPVDRPNARKADTNGGRCWRCRRRSEWKQLRESSMSVSKRPRAHRSSGIPARPTPTPRAPLYLALATALAMLSAPAMAADTCDTTGDGTPGMAVGQDALSCGAGAIAVGAGASAIGSDSTAAGEDATAVGSDSTAAGENATAVGA